MAKDKEFEKQYKAERLRRKLIRRAARKLKFNHSCKCKRNPRSAEYHSCPYAEDMHGDYSEACRCCGECSYNCAQDI